MDDYLQKINDIMKLYFKERQQLEDTDLKIKQVNEELQKIEEPSEKREERLSKKRELERELGDLIIITSSDIKNIEDKKIETIEGSSRSLSDNPNTFIGYDELLKESDAKTVAELVKGYDKLIEAIKISYKVKEKDLLKRIGELSKKTFNEELIKERDSKLESLKKLNIIRNVNLKELVETKLFVSKEILNYKKDLEMKLNDNKNDENIVIRELQEAQNKNYEEKIKKIDEYLKILALTEEENIALLKPLTEEEQKEYDRRRAYVEVKFNNENSDVIDTSVSTDTEVEIDGNEVSADSKVDLIKSIYNEILNEIDGIKTIKLSPSKKDIDDDYYYISVKDNNEDYDLLNNKLNLDKKTRKLPNGEYVNVDDIIEGLDKYYTKNSDTIYEAGDTFRRYKISKIQVDIFREKLKKCSTLKLVPKTKTLDTDIYKIFGKIKGNKEYSELAIINTDKIKGGEYLNKLELLLKLDDLFKLILINDNSKNKTKIIK